MRVEVNLRQVHQKKRILKTNQIKIKIKMKMIILWMQMLQVREIELNKNWNYKNQFLFNRIYNKTNKFKNL